MVSWAAFHPETRVYALPETVVPIPTTEPVKPGAQLDVDFEIMLYQGADVLGRKTAKLSQVLALGKPVVLNFWAGLCPVCREELPELQRVSDEYSDRLLVIGVDIGPMIQLGNREDALALLREKEISYPAGATGDVRVLFDLQVLGTPATFFLKPDGEIVRRWNGALSGHQLAGYVQELLEAAGGA